MAETVTKNVGPGAKKKPVPVDNRKKGKALIILNPVAGNGTSLRVLPDLIRGLTEQGYICTVLTTTKRGDGTEYVIRYGRECACIICSGGDGTASEIINGIMTFPEEERPDFGYIPAGSTNDFAATLGLPKRRLEAVRLQIDGNTIPVDIGRFNDKYFAYVCAFGAFTSVSYSTPQSAKNVFRGLAYYAKSIEAMKQISPIRARFTINGEVIEDSFVFCSISNAHIIGGVMRLRKPDVYINDGLFEVVLMHYPEDAIGFTKIINAIAAQDLSCEYIRIFQSREVEIEILDGPVDFSLDGECQQGVSHAVVTNIHSGIRAVAKEIKRKDQIDLFPLE